MSNSFKPIQVLDDFTDSVTKVMFTDDQVIATSVDGYIRTYDIRMGKLIRDNIEVPMNSFDIGEDKKFLLVSCLNSTVKLLDNSLGETIAEYKGAHKSDQYHGSVKFSKDNSNLVQASEDHRIVLYDLVTKEELMSLKGHLRPVVSLDRHPTIEGRYISGSADGYVKVWSPSAAALVESFEIDFANGWFFGEILKQYQYIEDLSTFSKKQEQKLNRYLMNRPNKEGKVKNFAQVEAILRQLKVQFDAKLINQIMNEERGAALRLLYQIKLAIQKDKPELFNAQAQSSNMKTMTNLQKQTVDQRFQETLQLKQTLPTMKNGLTTMNKSKKLQPIEKNLLKYEHTMQNQITKAYSEQRQEEEFLKKLVQDQRTLSLNKMSENRQFMQEWEAEGRKNWRANQKKMADMKAREKYFEDKEVTAFKNKLMKELDEHTNVMLGGIDEFEKNLQKLGIEKNTNIEEAKKRMEEKKGIPPGQIQNFSYAATMNKIKENKNMQDFAAKERDRRRRKMVVDQTRTQQNLDKKKNEAELIEKLMKKQAEEQQFAYLEMRNTKCKELIIKNREEKSAQYEAKAKADMEVIEKKRREEHAAVVQAHNKQIQEQKKYFREVRRQEKIEKRKVNIEIASEVIDLILDVADQAYEKTSKRKNKKLEKPEWREWMSIFSEGKLVSSVVGDNQTTLSQSLVGDDELNKDSTEDPLLDPTKQIEDILDDMKFDPAYEDLLQYLSVTGMFNLQLEGFNAEWGEFQNINFLEGLDMNFQFLDSLIPQANPELGRNMSDILMNLWKEDKTDKSMRIPIKEEGIPNYLPLKLCLLGRKFAGKRTVAKQIQDLYPGKIKIFKMDDMIKEAYEYVSPKPQAIEDKMPQKKVAKKTEEPVFVDQYAGQDTTKYREIGNQIKAILGENFDFNTVASSPQDLMSMILDDTILIRLFIQKLKLTYPVEKPMEVKLEEIKANLAREKELLEQLNDIEQSNQAASQMDAKKKAPPAKGKAAVSNEDQIKAELEQIQKVQLEGWILLDFPRTLSQAKLMEKHITGYTCVVDQLKSLEQKKFEQWSKLVTPASTYLDGEEKTSLEPKIYKSAADAFLFLEVSQNETSRRVQGRKIDPQTGTIYHLEDNPPPENDAKLRDRLQDYVDPEAEPSKVNHSHLVYDQNSNSLMKWISGFGHSDQEFTQITPVECLVKVEINEKKKKDEVFQEVLKKLYNITGFKQAQFDALRQKVKDQMTQETLLAQESQQQKVPPQLLEDFMGEPVKEQQLKEEENKQDFDEEQKQLELEVQKSQHSAVKQSQQSVRSKHTAHKSELEKLPITNKQKKDLWETFEQSYYKDSLLVFRNIKRQRELVFDGLVDTQQRFMDYLHRSDTKQLKIHDFVESFNKFSDEFPDLREDQQTKEELLNRVERLNNDLWSIIETRKDEALAEHQRIIKTSWIQHEMKKLIRYANTIINSEIKKYNVIYKMIVGQEQSQAVQVDQQFNSFVDQGIEPIDLQGKSPLLTKLFAYILKVVQYQYSNLFWLEPQTVKMLQIECENLIFRLNMVNTWITLKLKEFHTYSTQVYDVLDDWVLIAVEEENRAVQTVIKNLEEAIMENQLRLEYHQFKIEPLDLYSKIQIQQYSASMSPAYMLNTTVPSDSLAKRFKIEDIEHFYKDMRYYSFEEYLDGQTFIHLVVLALKENRAPNAWRFFDFSAFNSIVRNFKVTPLGHESNQNSVYSLSQEANKTERDFIDWKKVLTRFILLQTQFINDSLDQYEEALKPYLNDESEIAQDIFIQVPAWYDQQEGKNEVPSSKINLNDSYDDEIEATQEIDHDRVQRIKLLLFQTHQTNTRKLKVNVFMECLREIAGSCYPDRTPYQSLFE